MMYELVLQKSVTVPGVNSVGHISHVTSDQVWISDGTKSLILTNTLGDELQHLKDVLTTFTGVHTVNIDGDLIYIDRKYNISKLCTENKLRTLLINLTEPWEPQCVYSSPSTGDLLVGMRYYTNLTNIGKVVRYNSTGKIIQTIQHNNITGQGLYSRPKYITENRNGDVIVSDLYRFAVVVTDRDGNYRFSYTGPPPAHQLKPLGICTDALSHILVCDFITWSVQMLDQHGKFLSQILLHGIDKPQCLSYDEETHLLWVGAYNNYTVKIYKVVDGDSLTDTLVPTLPPVPQNLILSPSTLRTPQPASSQDRPQLESTYPRTVLTAQITSTSTLVRPRSPLSQERVESIHPWTASPDVCPSTRSTMEDFGPPNTQEIREFSYPWTAPSSTVTSATTLEGLRSPLTQGRHQLESTYPWIPPAHMSSIRSTLEQLGPPGTRERPQLVSSHLSTTHPVDVTPTQHPIEFEREFDDFPSSSTKTVPVSESPPPRKTRKLVQRGNIKETIEEFKEDVGLPGSSKEIVYDDPMFPPVKKIFKSKIDQKWLQKERTSFRSVIKFNEKLEQLKENGEFEIRIQRLIKYLNIETSHRSYQGYHVESTGYEEIIQRVDYLDCSGLHFSTAEKKTSFKPFSQSSVDDFLGWMAVFDKVFRKTRSPKCRLILSILFSACTKETLLKFNPRHLSLIIHKCLDYAIENQNHIFLVELVRSYIFQFDFHLDKLFRGKKVNFVVIDTFLTAAKFMILRECPRLPQNSIKLSFCYECRKEKRLVMMVSYKDSIDMKDGLPNSAMGLKLVFYNYTEPSEEASTVFNSFQASCLSQQMPIIAEKDARKLFKEHSNLTQISTSPFKSTGYSRGKHRVVQKQCISLLCLHKGYIPLGEREFPKEIHGFEVDIQEGYCSLGRGRSVDAGGHIRRARGMNTPGCGSIGGFVDLTNDPQNPNRHTAGLITCAHVVFSSDELKIPRNELIHILDKDTDFEVEVFDKNQHEFKVCGRIVDACFSALVDAALIQLDPTVSDFQFRATSAEQLLTAGFDPNKPPVFNGKAVLDEDLLQSKIPRKLGSVVKYGSTTGFTIGNLYPNEVHINFVSENGDLPDKTQSVMYHQIEIQSLPHGTFFKPGDSGSFVFCINQDKTLSCLGMAIGSTTKGSCLVTPMVRILRSFDCCKTESLKPCPLNVDKNTSRASDNPSNAQHNSNTSQINLEAEIGSLKNTVKNLRRRVQSDSRNFKREIGNLKTEVEILRMQIQLETSRGNPNPS